MLLNIHVKNMALIQEADIDLKKGLNNLTGETGAGKSIIIGSVNVALGASGFKGFAKEGADYALVELVFSVDGEEQEARLKELESPVEDGQIIISRKLVNGRSISKINGETVPVSTLRYYDKEGLFPEMRRVSGIRQFSEKEIEALRVIECLKKSGLEIRDIKQFMQWCTQGSKTYAQRRELFEKQRGQVESEIRRLGRVLDMLKFKCWYYEQAVRDGDETRLSRLRPEEMPDEIRQAYLRSH